MEEDSQFFSYTKAFYFSWLNDAFFDQQAHSHNYLSYFSGDSDCWHGSKAAGSLIFME
jgi:hypothetical protein